MSLTALLFVSSLTVLAQPVLLKDYNQASSLVAPVTRVQKIQ